MKRASNDVKYRQKLAVRPLSATGEGPHSLCRIGECRKPQNEIENVTKPGNWRLKEQRVHTAKGGWRLNGEVRVSVLGDKALVFGTGNLSMSEKMVRISFGWK